jgi:hypothetical protein
MLTIPAEIHNAVMMLTEAERKDRAIVNETVRTGRTPLRPAGTADQYRVPIAAAETNTTASQNSPLMPDFG